MPNMKIDMNHNLLTQTIEKSNSMVYYEKTVKLIARVIEDLKIIQWKKVQDLHKGIFCIKDLKSLDKNGVMC